MRSHIARASALASVLLGIAAQAAPASEESDDAVNVYDIFPIQVVVEKPIAIELFCPENGVYPVDEDIAFTVTNAPTFISTRTTKYSTHQTQSTIYRGECEQAASHAMPTGATPWAESCLPASGANITIPPHGDRKMPLTLEVPGNSHDLCAARPSVATQAKYQTVPTDYVGPCSTITDYFYGGPTQTTYRFPPGPGETLGLEIICKPGAPRPHACDACTTYTKIVNGLPTPITISLDPTGTQTEGTIIIITPPPDFDGDGTVTVTNPLITGTDAITTTLDPGAPGDPTTVVVLEPTEGGVTTITRPATGTEPGASTILPAPGSGGQTTVITFVPTQRPGGTVTITSTIVDGPEFTSTVTAADPSDPNTVIIGTSVTATTITIIVEDGSPGFTTTVAATDPSDPDTVTIGLPSSEQSITQAPTTTFTVPIESGSSFETTITGTNGGPDTVIIGSPAPQEPNTDPGREFPDLPGLPLPTETATTEAPGMTVDSTSSTSLTPTFVFTSSSSATATETSSSGEGSEGGGEATETDGNEDATSTDDGGEATATDDGGEEATSTDGGEEATSSTGEEAPLETADAPDTSCDNIGFRYTIIPHDYYNFDAPLYSSVDVVALRESRPAYIGQTRSIGYPPYRGAPEFRNDFIAHNHEAWLYALVRGTYTFFLDFADDIVFIWVGQDAYSGWTRENADIELGFNDGSRVLSVTLEAGVLVPIRILAVNGQGGYFFRPELRDPNGLIIANSDGIDDRYIISDTCEDEAPDFPPQKQPLTPEELVTPPQ